MINLIFIFSQFFFFSYILIICFYFFCDPYLHMIYDCIFSYYLVYYSNSLSFWPYLFHITIYLYYFNIIFLFLTFFFFNFLFYFFIIKFINKIKLIFLLNQHLITFNKNQKENYRILKEEINIKNYLNEFPKIYKKEKLKLDKKTVFYNYLNHLNDELKLKMYTYFSLGILGNSDKLFRIYLLKKIEYLKLKHTEIYILFIFLTFTFVFFYLLYIYKKGLIAYFGLFSMLRHYFNSIFSVLTDYIKSVFLVRYISLCFLIILFMFLIDFFFFFTII